MDDRYRKLDGYLTQLAARGEKSKPSSRRWKAITENILRIKREFGNEYPHREFPDLSVPKLGTPVTNGMSGSTAKKPRPVDAKQYPVGNLHKSGLQMITPDEDPRAFNGSKRTPMWRPEKKKPSAGTASGFATLEEIRKRES